MHELTTPRLTLRSWRDQDRDAFAAMNADPIVMADQGGPISRELSDAKLDRYSAAFADHDFGRWLIERIADDGKPEYLGYAGVMPVTDEHPAGAHYEIGWRLRHEAWGHGFATEAASAALDDVFTRCGVAEVLSYTEADNHRSRAVMGRLGLRRDPALDFVDHFDVLGDWPGLVWVAAAPTTSQGS